MLTLYSTGCPKCNILKKKLDIKGLSYEVNNNVDEMIERGFVSAPMLIDGDKAMTFDEAIIWLS